MMNEPPVVPATALSADNPGYAVASIAEDATEREPITGMIGLIEAVLRHPRRIVWRLRSGDDGWLVPGLLTIAVVLIGVYGVIVGSFSGGVQWWASPAKSVAGLIVTAAICLPSLY